MNWEAIGAIGEICGAGAVVVSLIYLALQIRHSTRETQAASRDSMAKLTIDILMRMASNPSMLTLLRKGQVEPSSLDAEESFRFDTILFSILESWETTFAQWKRGALTNEDWVKWEVIIASYFSQSGTQEFWSRSSAQFGQTFRSYVEDLQPKEAYSWDPETGDT